MTETGAEFEAENPFDAFEEGQEIPVEDRRLTVVDVERGLNEYPDNEGVFGLTTTSKRKKSPVKWPITVLTLRDEEGNETRASAEQVERLMGVNFSERGMHSISAFRHTMNTEGAKIVPPSYEHVPTSRISAEEATELAEFLHENAEFEPLYALLGNVNGPDDVRAMADALENVALARELRQEEA